MATAAPPNSARRYYAVSALVATRAGNEAASLVSRGLEAVWQSMVRFQVMQATLAAEGVTAMLDEQGIDVEPDAALNLAGFTTSLETFQSMTVDFESDAEFQRIVESITQDAARAAQSVTVATRNHVAYVRHLTLPSCSRCAVLASRVYRYSTGFQRHPGCDCVMIPTTIANDALTYDPVELARDGQVTGLSKADLRAVQAGADFNRVVNVRSSAAGLKESGVVLLRAGRMTPEAIYRTAGSDRDKALDLLKKHGYVL